MKPYNIKRPKDLADYIRKNCAAKTYLIFDRKKDICVCTRCGAKTKISKMNDGYCLEHNREHYCYSCRTGAICKENRYGRKNITDYGRILYLSKRGRDTYAQLDEYMINYDRYMLPEVSARSIAPYKFNKDEQVYLKYNYGGYCTDSGWLQSANVKIPAPARNMFTYASKFEATYFYEPSRKNIGTDLKYANMDMKRLGYNERNHWEPYWIIGYLNNFAKYQSIELLEKSGFEKIVGDRARGEGCRYINWRGKTLRKILKMNNAELRDARRLDIGINGIEAYWRTKKMFPGFSLEESIELSTKYSLYNFDRILPKIEKHIDIVKAAEYLLTQKDMTFRDYGDYLHECKSLGMDLKDKKILKPKDLRTAHEKTSQQLKISLDKKKQKQFAASILIITGMTEPYYFGDYLIRPAASPEELHGESAALHHCVRTYVDSVSEGRTSILFIRKKDDPDKPLYTLELDKNKKVVQCRGDHNCSYPGEVQELIDHWMKDVIKKNKKE